MIWKLESIKLRGNIGNNKEILRKGTDRTEYSKRGKTISKEHNAHLHNLLDVEKPWHQTCIAEETTIFDYDVALPHRGASSIKK